MTRHIYPIIQAHSSLLLSTLPPSPSLTASPVLPTSGKCLPRWEITASRTSAGTDQRGGEQLQALGPGASPGASNWICGPTTSLSAVRGCAGVEEGREGGERREGGEERRRAETGRRREGTGRRREETGRRREETGRRRKKRGEERSQGEERRQWREAVLSGRCVCVCVEEK